MEPAVYYWVPSIATSGLAFYTGDLFPNWKGNAFVGGLKERASCASCLTATRSLPTRSC